MDTETWMNVNKTVEYGFADSVLEDVKSQIAEKNISIESRGKRLNLSKVQHSVGLRLA